jgi:uncharacterized repeat protein (TIGR03943 family)
MRTVLEPIELRGPEARRPGWSGSRLLAAATLGAWSGMFWFLLGTGRTGLYLSTRTTWIVPVGAVILGLAALGLAASARVVDPAPVRRSQVLLAGALLIPVALVLASPRATLGSFSAGRKASSSGSGLQTYWGTFDRSSEITLSFVTAAQFWPGGTELLAERAGSEVDFVGFVDRDPDTPADEFLLTRFVVSCCVADATVTQVRVVNVPAGAFAVDEWVEVRGQIYPVGTEIIVTADVIEPVPAPDVPYLTP